MRILLITLLCAFSMSVQAKGKPSLKKADKYYKNTEYTKAAEEYRRLVRGVRTDNYIFLQLADCYDRLSKDIEASRYYGKAIVKDPDVPAEVYYKYAKVLERNGRYVVAKEVMQQFAAKAAGDSRAKDFLANPNAHDLLADLEPRYSFAESGMNDRVYDTYGAWMNAGDTIYMVSNRTKHEKKIPRKLFEVREKWEGKPNTDIYFASFKGKAEPTFEVNHVKGRVNKRFHDGMAVSSPDGQRFYFASEAYRNRKFRSNKEVKHRDRLMSLFYAKLKGKQWKKIKPLPFTKAGYMYTNPTISSDGKYLYFASNMPGSLGELDLWRVALLEDDEFGQPENLGPAINSGTRNDYPFLAEDNKLYFTSDRWGGYGGMDIYVVDMNTPGSKPVNVGAPINTVKNDFAFSYYPSKEVGLFSSDRIGRKDVYKALPVCNIEFSVLAKNKQFNKPVADAQVEFINDRRNVEGKVYTRKNGVAREFITCKGKYKIKVSHPDYLDEVIEVVGNDTEGVQSIEVMLRPLDELMIEEDKISLADIQFAFDQVDITEESKEELNKLVKVMKRYPNMRIKVNSHSDSKGKAEYNLKLSQARAKSTVEYLISQGIEADRLEYQGYGSQELKVICEPCTEWENAQNRRSEFIILSK